MFSGILQQFNPFFANAPILFPLKTPQNQTYFESSWNSIHSVQINDGKKKNIKERDALTKECTNIEGNTDIK